MEGRLVDGAHYSAMKRDVQNRLDQLASAGITHWLQRWNEAVAAHGAHPCVVEAESQGCWSYSDLDRLGSEYLKFDGLPDRGYIAIRIENSAAFVAAYLAVLKAGGVPVLLNVREKSEKLDALMDRLGVDAVLVETGPATIRVDCRTRAVSGARRDPVPAEDGLNPAAIIFTSGTTSVSKAANFSHRRLVGAGVAWGLRTGMSENSRCYIATPMWHGNGLAVAFASCVERGATAVVRRRFSVRHFWNDIASLNCDAMVYVGELWRYLLSSGNRALSSHSLTTAFGNGLDKLLWQAVKAEFGIRRIVEHYGATEMPGNAMLNCDGEPGACGYVPPGHPDENSYLLVCEDGKVARRGQAGELLISLGSGSYCGYADEALNEQRLLRHVLQPNDCWWRSGDRLRWEESGYFFFEGRLCENFRWKGENISALEIEQALLASGAFAHACAYGVPVEGYSGKAPMATVWPVRKDWHERLANFLQDRLADYAIPLYLRVIRDAPHTTSTHKIIRSVYEELGHTHDREEVWHLYDGAYRPTLS